MGGFIAFSIYGAVSHSHTCTVVGKKLKKNANLDAQRRSVNLALIVNSAHRLRCAAATPFIL